MVAHQLLEQGLVVVVAASVAQQKLIARGLFSFFGALIIRDRALSFLVLSFSTRFDFAVELGTG